MEAIMNNKWLIGEAKQKPLSINASYVWNIKWGKKISKSVSQINASLDTIFAVSGLIADSFLGKKETKSEQTFHY